MQLGCQAAPRQKALCFQCVSKMGQGQAEKIFPPGKHEGKNCRNNLPREIACHLKSTSI
jgi:hypothetical protein